MASQQESKTEKEIFFKKSKEPSSIQRESEPFSQPSRASKEPLMAKQLNNEGEEDDRPISKEVDFMALLDREMKKENQIEVKGGAKIER
jgi:hypothetical protein